MQLIKLSKLLSSLRLCVWNILQLGLCQRQQQPKTHVLFVISNRTAWGLGGSAGWVNWVGGYVVVCLVRSWVRVDSIEPSANAQSELNKIPGLPNQLLLESQLHSTRLHSSRIAVREICQKVCNAKERPALRTPQHSTAIQNIYCEPPGGAASF